MSGIYREGQLRCIGYRIVEVKDDNFLTLFHGHNGSRYLQQGVWLQADTTKQVRDGGHTYYFAGWHILKDRERALAYMSRFKKPRDLRVIEVWHECNVRFKPTNPDVMLTEWMYIPRGQL